MHINLEEISEIKEVSIKEFNVHEINSIKYLYEEVRQNSKTPTFPFNLSWY